MQTEYGSSAGVRIAGVAAIVLTLCSASGQCALANRAVADRANAVARIVQSSYERTEQPSDYQPMFGLDYLHADVAPDCQVPLPPIGAVSPFPLALRLGAMLSPRTAFAGGIDATIPGIHLLPGFSTRVDADAIVSAGLRRTSTLVPLTFNQIYNLNLPVSSRVYAGAGIGPYIGDTTRFGGKLILGAEFSRLGLEGNIHFAGIGDPLFTIQARIGL